MADLKTTLTTERTIRLQKIQVLQTEADALDRVLRILDMSAPESTEPAPVEQRAAEPLGAPLMQHVAEQLTESKKKRGRLPKERKCDKHPSAAFYKNGVCVLCAREYAKAKWREKHPPKQKEVLPEGMRRCKGECAAVKPIEDFSKSGYGGRRAVCKECQRPMERQEPAEKKKLGRPLLPATTPTDVADSIAQSENEAMDGLEALKSKGHAEEREFVYSSPVQCPKCFSRNVRLRRLKDADVSKDYWLHVKANGDMPCTIKIAHYSIKVAKAQYAAEA